MNHGHNNARKKKGIRFFNFELVFSRTDKNRLISSFSLIKVLLLLGYISECSINLEKKRKICCGWIGKLDFWNFLFNSRESHFNKSEVKTRKINFSREYHQIEALMMPRRKSAYSVFDIFSFSGRNLGFYVLLKNNSEKFLRKWKFRIFMNFKVT
jgi:hypothetical protein